MEALLLGLGCAGGWLLVADLRHRGFTGLGLEKAVMAAATVVYALYLIAVTGHVHELDWIQAMWDKSFSGYGVPLAHWWPHTPRPFLLLGVIIAIGIIDKIRVTLRQGPGD